MGTTSVRIGTEQHAKLAEISEETGVPLRRLFDDAVDEYYEQYQEEKKMLRELREKREN